MVDTLLKSSLYKHLFTLLILLGVMSFFVFFSQAHTSSQAEVMVRLELIAQFTGSAQPTGSTFIDTSPIYRTTGGDQLLTLQASTTVSFVLSGDLHGPVTGQLIGGGPEIVPITLLSGEGIKNIQILYTNEDNELITLQTTYGIDTTPPPLTYSFSGPPSTTQTSQPILFNRDAVVDTGVGLDTYIIQVSNSPIFSTAMHFTTTGTELVLGAGSIGPGNRYRRRGANDLLGHTIYGTSVPFIVQSTTHSGGGGGSGSGTTIGSGGTHTPDILIVKDICPGKDRSSHSSDGLCSPVTEPPILINVPESHQSADTRNRREKARAELTNTKPPLYTFPNYEPPQIYTIYEREQSSSSISAYIQNRPGATQQLENRYGRTIQSVTNAGIRPYPRTSLPYCRELLDKCIDALQCTPCPLMCYYETNIYGTSLICIDTTIMSYDRPIMSYDIRPYNNPGNSNSFFENIADRFLLPIYNALLVRFGTPSGYSSYTP